MCLQDKHITMDNSVPDTPENRAGCICPRCPSYPQDCPGELLYCGVGKSRCEINAQGCICPGCIVYLKYKLDGLYFCNKTAAGENHVLMRKKKLHEDPQFYATVANIKEIARTGKSLVRSMGSRKKLPYSLDDLFFIPAQVAKIPRNTEEKVNCTVTIGKRAKKPLKLSSPVLISGMSFGAVSKNVKLCIARAAKDLKIAFNSGEGGVLKEELGSADFLISQYATGRFGLSKKLIKKSAAVEIRFGQGAYPGKGSYLPAEKMTDEVSRLRGLKPGQAAYSPAHHADMRTLKEIKAKIDWLRRLTGGIPVGAKIGCGRVEEDVKILAEAGVDFITLDGFGGGTGATEAYIRDNVGLPIWAALPRAQWQLAQLNLQEKVSLIASGGLRSGADFAKCLALGADAVYTGTAALVAINCEQYRICHTGLCPTGVTTHNPALTKQLNIAAGTRKLKNFIKVATEEVAGITRAVGKDDIADLDGSDLVTLNRELAEICQVPTL